MPSSAVEDVKAKLFTNYKIAPYCCWTGGTWQPWGRKWNDIQNITKILENFVGF